MPRRPPASKPPGKKPPRPPAAGGRTTAARPAKRHSGSGHSRQDRPRQEQRPRPEQRRERQPGTGREPAAERRPNIRVGSSRKVVEAAIALLDAISLSGEPADRVRHAWMRSNHRRFEAAERTALIQISEDVLRMRGRLDWWLSSEGGGGKAGLPPDNRLRVAAWRILAGGAKSRGLLPMFEADDAAVPVLLQRLEGHTMQHPDMPRAARFSVPDWVLPHLEARFGADTELELAAMLRPAPLDVRINPLKTTRDAVAALLTAEEMRNQPTPFSPLGLRLSPLGYVNNTQAYADGLLEPQDEGSQIAAQLVDAAGGKLVVDYCAGAGGKTLVLAAAMKNSGRLVAMDVNEGRLTQAKLRLRRAGVHNAECRAVETKWLKRHAGEADRVLVDAPCTGTGTWRRKPDAKWRLAQRDLDELVPRQAEILDRAAKLVKPGGRLVYVTCSVLKPENEDQILAFLRRHPDFDILPVGEVWPQAIGGACPVAGEFLTLSPGRHGTDGFFAAILVRRV